MPKSALPPELRRKMGFAPRRGEENDEGNKIWQAGSGVLRKVGSGRDGTYLKRGSGIVMSQRASRLAQIKEGGMVRTANISRPALQNSNCLVLNNKRTKRTSFGQADY